MTRTRARNPGGDDPRLRPLARLLLLARVLGAAALGLLAVTALTPLANTVARGLVTPDSPMPVDAIVVLAATIHEDGTLSDDSLRRLVRAIELYGEGRAPLLILSGVQRTGLDEAAVRAALARRLGVPAPAIVTLTGSHTTHEEGLAIAAILGPRGARRVLIVTDWTHAARARATLRQAGLDARVAVPGRPADAATTPEGRLGLAWKCAREVLARSYYRLAGLA